MNGVDSVRLDHRHTSVTNLPRAWPDRGLLHLLVTQNQYSCISDAPDPYILNSTITKILSVLRVIL